MNTVTVSVIIPVYNSEKHLNICIDSVLAQTYSDFELLLINDGSTDSSGAICDYYAEKDSRVKVFHKENGGVSSARNIGMENAKGKYSIHVDSDDYIESVMLERLLAKAMKTNSDMVICDYYVKDGENIKKVFQGNFTNNKDCTANILTGNMHGSLCNKLIKNSLYKQFSIKCPEHISIREDMFVVISLLLLDINVSYLNEAFYYYVVNPVSITRQSDDRKIQKHINGADEILSLFNNDFFYYRSIVTFKLQIRVDVFVLLCNSSHIKRLYPETNKYIFKETKLPLWVRIAMISAVFGLGFIAKCIFYIRKLKLK